MFFIYFQKKVVLLPAKQKFFRSAIMDSKIAVTYYSKENGPTKENKTKKTEFWNPNDIEVILLQESNDGDPFPDYCTVLKQDGYSPKTGETEKSKIETVVFAAFNENLLFEAYKKGSFFIERKTPAGRSIYIRSDSVKNGQDIPMVGSAVTFCDGSLLLLPHRPEKLKSVFSLFRKKSQNTQENQTNTEPVSIQTHSQEDLKIKVRSWPRSKIEEKTQHTFSFEPLYPEDINCVGVPEKCALYPNELFRGQDKPITTAAFFWRAPISQRGGDNAKILGALVSDEAENAAPFSKIHRIVSARGVTLVPIETNKGQILVNPNQIMRDAEGDFCIENVITLELLSGRKVPVLGKDLTEFKASAAVLVAAWREKYASIDWIDPEESEPVLDGQIYEFSLNSRRVGQRSTNLRRSRHRGNAQNKGPQ